jgi:hypothetical protein
MSDAVLQGMQIDVHYPDGRSEQLFVDADRVLIGSGSHCEVRLPAENAALEHVRLSLIAGGVHAQARSLSPHPTIDGTGFVRSPVQPDSVLGVGGVKLWAAAVELEDQRAVIRKRTQKTSPLAYVALAVGVAITGYLISIAPEAEPSPMAPGDPPALWDEPTGACPQASHDAALAVALDKFDVAGGKRERRPFRVEDGVAAVPLFETAAACFRVAGEKAASSEADDDARDLRAKVNEDYRAHQVRLEHALMVEDWPVAQQEVGVLRELTRGRRGQYVAWLSNLDRRLQLKLGRAEGAS